MLFSGPSSVEPKLGQLFSNQKRQFDTKTFKIKKKKKLTEILKCSIVSIPLRRTRSIRTRLRADGLLNEFLKDHAPDMINRRYAQCFPSSTPSLRLGRTSERIYNFMDVRRTTLRVRVAGSKPSVIIKISSEKFLPCCSDLNIPLGVSVFHKYADLLRMIIRFKGKLLISKISACPKYEAKVGQKQK